MQVEPIFASSRFCHAHLNMQKDFPHLNENGLVLCRDDQHEGRRGEAETVELWGNIGKKGNVSGTCARKEHSQGRPAEL